MEIYHYIIIYIAGFFFCGIGYQISVKLEHEDPELFWFIFSPFWPIAFPIIFIAYALPKLILFLIFGTANKTIQLISDYKQNAILKAKQKERMKNQNGELSFSDNRGGELSIK